MSAVAPKRKEDIPPLIAQFVRQFLNNSASRSRTFHRSLSEIARLFVAGNVRELQNAIEYAVVLTRQGVIGVKDCPQRYSCLQRCSKPKLADCPQGRANLDDLERNAFSKHCRVPGEQEKAAELLGIQRPRSTTR